MKVIDLRRQHVSLDELLRSVGGDVVRITSKDGNEFIVEAAGAFGREAEELGRSAKLLAFLAERSAEFGRVPLADIESRLGGSDPTSGAPGATTGSERGPSDGGPAVPAAS